MRSILNALQSTLPQLPVNAAHSIYNRLPASIRYGKIYRDARTFLNKSQYWTIEQHNRYQLSRLQELVHHAFYHVPFYRELYRSHGIHPLHIKSLTDIRYLPLVDKEMLRNHLEKMKTEHMGESSFQYHTTGGSTGVPVGLYWDAQRTIPLERAFIRRQWNWAGFEMGQDRSITLRGVPVAGNKLYEKINDTQIRLSVYDLTPDNLDKYIEIINKFRPTAIQAYPSAAFILAQHINDASSISFPSLQVILCGSENLYPWQREAISTAFGCRVYSWYGQSEYVALAGECEYSTDLHSYSEYGITEVITNDLKPANCGEAGEIIATGFNNLAMPLIRYRTGDIARFSATKQCACKRNYPLIESIDGRMQEMIVSKNQNLISMTSINMHDTTFDHVLQFQFYQDTPGVVVLRIVKKNGFTDIDERKIQKELRKKLKEQVDITIEYTTEIRKTPRGKLSFLVQMLPIKNFSVPHKTQ